MNRITLHEIAVGELEGEGDGEGEGESQQLSTLSPEALQALKKEDTQYQITVMEERLEQLSPNMAAIEAYRKKVSAHLASIIQTPQGGSTFTPTAWEINALPMLPPGQPYPE